VSPAADDVRVQEGRRRIAALPHDTELVGLRQAELVAWVARMHGAAQLLDGFVRDVEMPGEAQDTRRLDRIRVVLAKFDWEHDDRQLALEAIERIVEGGQA
jgi:uncharacterized protein YneR